MNEARKHSEVARIFCRVDEFQWSDSLVWGNPRREPSPTVEPGKIVRLQLWMTPDRLAPTERSNRAVTVIDRNEPRYVLNGLVANVALSSFGSNVGRSYISLETEFPAVFVIPRASRSELTGIEGKCVIAEGRLYGDISIWRGPLFLPVTVKIESIVEVSGGDRVMELTRVSGREPDVQVDWAWRPSAR